MSLLVRGTAAAVGRSLTPDLLTRLRPGHSLGEFSAQIGVPLADHQLAALTLAERITAIVAPRQAGKSRALAVLALHCALETSGLQVLIVSAGETAAVRLLSMIRRMALNATPGSVPFTDESRFLLRFPNGSEVRCVPASERQIRGWTIDLLIIDEAALVEDDLIQSAAIPTTAARENARIVLVSSPLLAVGAFYRFVIDGEEDAPGIAAYRWTLTQSPWISADLVEQARSQMPPAKFAAEYLGEFPESGVGLLIPRPWLREAQARELPGRERGTFGVDVAEAGEDFTVIYRQRGGVARLEAKVHGEYPPEVARRVAALLQAAPATPAIVDALGVGSGVAAQLREWGLHVVPFRASNRAWEPERFANRKAEVFWALRLAFQRGEMDIDPTDHQLFDELAEMRYAIDNRGRTVIEQKSDMRARGLKSPDHADALAMAVGGAPIDLKGMGELGEVAPRPRPKPSPGGIPRSMRVAPGEAARLRERKM